MALRLDGSIRQLSCPGNAFRKFASSPRNVEYHPMRTSSVFRCMATSGSWRIKAKLTVPRGHMAPFELGRNRIRIRLSILRGYFAAVGERRSGQSQAGTGGLLPLFAFFLRHGRAEAGESKIAQPVIARAAFIMLFPSCMAQNTKPAVVMNSHLRHRRVMIGLASQPRGDRPKYTQRQMSW